ncbi:MAG: phage holin family protein [Romboutsia sp.]|nr:phage holin family protein [Romboutsia sp.]
MDQIKGSIAIIGTIFTWLFGAWDMALIVLISFMVLDYITGLIKGWNNKSLSSHIASKGIARKSLIFIVLIVAVLLDRLLNTGTWVFRTLVYYFYIANEGISLLENCAELGVPIPDKIKETLVQLKNNEENKK